MDEFYAPDDNLFDELAHIQETAKNATPIDSEHVDNNYSHSYCIVA